MKIRVQTLRNKFNKRAHVQYEFSPALQNQHYCSKPIQDCECEHCSKEIDKVGGPWEYGTISHTREDGASQCDAYTHAGTQCKLLAKEKYCKSHKEFNAKDFTSSIIETRRLRKVGLTIKQIGRKTGLSDYQIKRTLKIPDSLFEELLRGLSES